MTSVIKGEVESRKGRAGSKRVRSKLFEAAIVDVVTGCRASQAHTELYLVSTHHCWLRLLIKATADGEVLDRHRSGWLVCAALMARAHLHMTAASRFAVSQHCQRLPLSRNGRLHSLWSIITGARTDGTDIVERLDMVCDPMVLGNTLLQPR